LGVYPGHRRTPGPCPQINIPRVFCSRALFPSAHLRHLGIMYGAWPEKEEHVQLCDYIHISYSKPPYHHFAVGSNVGATVPESRRPQTTKKNVDRSLHNWSGNKKFEKQHKKKSKSENQRTQMRKSFKNANGPHNAGSDVFKSVHRSPWFCGCRFLALHLSNAAELMNRNSTADLYLMDTK